jgi:4-amino-4-deoxy-L-arabinose transferase-like glycosyltransferase
MAAEAAAERSSRNIVMLLIVAAASVCASPWARDLFVGDETKYGQVVREMRATGAFFLPTLNGTPFTHKPPLHFWLVDLLTFPLGVYSTWAFVLPSIIGFLFLLWLMTRVHGPLAAFVCATSMMVWGSAQTARMDVSFTAFIVLGCWMLFRFFEDADFRALLMCGIALGVATLIKGPMAPVIAIILFLIEWWRRRAVPRGNYAPAIVAMIGIPLLWLVPAMIMGGRAYTRDVIVKQTVGRAIATWVHKEGPWYYLAHMPGIVFPWFLLLVIAIVAFRRGTSLQRFCISWIAAVVIPYSLMSSKLDVYMMAMIPPAAILVAELATHPPFARATRIANIMMLAIYAIIGAAGLLISPRSIKGPDASLIDRWEVRTVFALFAGLAIVELIIAFRRAHLTSTLVVGMIPLVVFTFAFIVLMPLANELSSTRPLLGALERQNVAPQEIALYTCPYLWTRGFPRAYEGVKYVDPDDLHSIHPTLIATSRVHAPEIAASLAGYHRVDSVRMIGKWFDVYRR